MLTDNYSLTAAALTCSFRFLLLGLLAGCACALLFRDVEFSKMGIHTSKIPTSRGTENTANFLQIGIGQSDFVLSSLLLLASK